MKIIKGFTNSFKINEEINKNLRNPLIKEILEIFILEGNGFWAAMQWLVSPDPNLFGKLPIELIWPKDKKLVPEECERILWAARAYCGL